MTPDALILAATDQNLYGIGAAIVIAIAGFGYTVVSGVRSDRRSDMTAIEGALNDRINDLVRQVAEAKLDAKECAVQRRQLEKENLRLMREVLKLENGHDPP